MPAQPPVRLYIVHGIGGVERNLSWQDSWRGVIREGFKQYTDRHVEVDFAAFDDIFKKYPLNPVVVAGALAKLSISGMIHGVGDMFRRERGLVQDVPETVRWTAGMLVQWADTQKLRQALRDVIVSDLQTQSYDAVLAHSLGSLVCYDTFRRPEYAKHLAHKVFVSFGSQIGNPFVRGILGGKLEKLPADFWYHLFNPQDRIFTRKLRVSGAGFKELELDIPGNNLLEEHEGERYLKHPSVVATVWPDIASDDSGATGVRSIARLPLRPVPKPRRALLVGINDYPNPADRLEGCVNDVFEMSSVLQELWPDQKDQEPAQIRVLLDDRATAAAIKERLEWLLEGTEDEQERVFFYSGHGAQVPGYGATEEVDHYNEVLVPYDFDWTDAHSISDDWFHDLYCQLPEKAKFFAIFDCCHSGGIHREGGPRVKGMTPPDDIRHRALKWNPIKEMWEERKLELPTDDGIDKAKRDAGWLGQSQATRFLGMATQVRVLSDAQKERKRTAYGGDLPRPYMPIVLQACSELEKAYEYRHGAISYGAFTYSMSKIFRQHARANQTLTFQALIDQAAKRLKELGYAQIPIARGPADQLTKVIVAPPDDGTPAPRGAKVPTVPASRPVPRARPAAKKAAPTKSAATKAPAKKTAAKKAAAKKPAAKTSGKTAATKKAPARKTAATKATTKRATRKK